MLKLLLDEHISPAVAVGMHRRNPDLTVYALKEWEAGNHLGQTDETILSGAAEQNLTLVTFDQRTIRPLAMNWAQDQRPHAGIIFVDEKTIAPGDIGGLIRALTELVDQCFRDDWSNRIVFLKR